MTEELFCFDELDRLEAAAAHVEDPGPRLAVTGWKPRSELSRMKAVSGTLDISNGLTGDSCLSYLNLLHANQQHFKQTLNKQSKAKQTTTNTNVYIHIYTRIYIYIYVP